MNHNLISNSTNQSDIILPIIIYFGIMIAIGIFFRSKINSEKRPLNTIQTAMSVAAADTSSWVMIALPAAIYSYGISHITIPIGLMIGLCLAWKIAPKFRKKTEVHHSSTLPSYLENCSIDTTIKNAETLHSHENSSQQGVHDKSGDQQHNHNESGNNPASNFIEKPNTKPSSQIKKDYFHLKYDVNKISSLIILFFLVAYISSGVKSASMLIENFTNIEYHAAVIYISIFISIYTMIAGISGISWGDIFQTTLILMSMISLIFSMYFDLHSSYDISQINMTSISNSMSDFFRTTLNNLDILTLISYLSWGLGYFGEPHILFKFISAKSVNHIRKASAICILWTFISFSCAVLIGIFGKKLFNLENPEKLFFTSVLYYHKNYIIGIFFVAVISAILSTICSQLIVCSGILVQHINSLKKHMQLNNQQNDNAQNENTQNEVLQNGNQQVEKLSKRQIQLRKKLTSGIITVVLCAISAVIAYDQSSKIMSIVSYAWAGLGASFGPSVLYSLYCSKVYKKSIFYGILFGFLSIICMGIMHYFGILRNLYELLPSFTVSSFAIYLSHRKEVSCQRKIQKMHIV